MWDYSHSGIIILGRVVEATTGKPLAQILADEVLTPAGLTETISEQTARIPEPIQHGFTAERGVYEDATFWNPSWTLAEGAVQTTTIDDMARSFDAIIGGEGTVLTPESRAQMIDPRLVGFGAPLEGLPQLSHADARLRVRTRGVPNPLGEHRVPARSATGADQPAEAGRIGAITVELWSGRRIRSPRIGLKTWRW